jgi:hypothetical protein
MPVKKYLINSYIAIFLFIFPSLTSCNDIPYGKYRIEWDEYDPSLHGQTVHFLKPMRYVFLEERHIGEYPKEDVEIGRILTTEEMVFEPGGYAKTGYVSEPIKDGMEFTVKTSYWYRRDWFERELVGDKRYLIMEDELGRKSVMLFGTFISSDKPELYKLRDEGRLK